jgi:hypothetical protein
MQRGVRVAGNGTGLLNGQTLKGDSIASVEGAGGGVVFKAGLKDTEPYCEVYLGHMPKVFRGPLRGFHDLLRQSRPLCKNYVGGFCLSKLWKPLIGSLKTSGT